MAVQYVRVQSTVNLFAPAVRAFGNIAVIGKVTAPGGGAPPIDINVPTAFTDATDALTRAPGDLGAAIALAFAQSPGPSLVIGVRVDSAAPAWNTALDLVANQDVQLVALANVPLNAANAKADAPEGPLVTLAKHVATVSESGGDGRQRMGVGMLPKDSTDLALFTGNATLAHERMVWIAHRSTQDAAAAVAGTIAGYEPHVSLLLKPVNINSPSFSQADIDRINGTETFTSGPAGKGVNWLTSPSIIPGNGVYLGEGYTGNPGGKKYIDIQRKVDDLTFRLNAQLIRSVGNLRISRSGLRAVIAQLEALLAPEVQNDVLNGFEVVAPLLSLLDRDPATLTAVEAERIHQAEVNRIVQIMVAVKYSGAIHRLSISLKFD